MEVVDQPVSGEVDDGVAGKVRACGSGAGSIEVESLELFACGGELEDVVGLQVARIPDRAMKFDRLIVIVERLLLIPQI